jgi:hypothetical protein
MPALETRCPRADLSRDQRAQANAHGPGVKGKGPDSGTGPGVSAVFPSGAPSCHMLAGMSHTNQERAGRSARRGMQVVDQPTSTTGARRCAAERSTAQRMPETTVGVT